MLRPVGAAISAACIALLIAGPAHAATFAVDRTDDSATGACTASPNDCTLRGAITTANATSGLDTITIPNGTYTPATKYDDISEELVLDGTSATGTVIDLGNALATVLRFTAPGAVRLDDLTVRNAVSSSTSVLDSSSTTALTLERVRLVDNAAPPLGSTSSGFLTIQDSTIARNTAPAIGGLVSQGTGGMAIRRSTIADNTATESGTSQPIAFAGGVVALCITLIEDSTIVRNKVTTSGNGSAIAGNLVTLKIPSASCATLMTVRNSIIAGGRINGGVNDCVTDEIQSSGYNLDSDGSCGFDTTNDRPGVDPRLGPLADNGGPTETVSLLADSPAIDNGGGCAATDQRGIARPLGGACDIGAFESAFTKPAPAPAPAPAISTPTPAATPGGVAGSAAPADTRAPAVTLKGLAGTLKRAALRKALKVTIGVDEPAAVEVALLGRTKKATLAKAGDLVLAEGRLARGTGTRSVTLKVDRALVAARGKRFTATLVVTAVDAAGNRTTVRRTVKVA